MYIHNYLIKKSHEENDEDSNYAQNGGIFSSLVYLYQYISGTMPKQFYYNVGGFNFTLDEFKHGVFRNNQKAPQNYLCSLPQKDDRLSILPDFEDNRILFICLDYPN